MPFFYNEPKQELTERLCIKCQKPFMPNKALRFKCFQCSPINNRHKTHRKFNNCFLCNKELGYGTKGKSKPFCNWNCELQYTILQNQKRQKIGCAIIE
jgi:hypothetical protein